MESIKLQIEPRFVKEENGFRPFQKQTINAIKNSDVKIIMVEAPVGSGKSYIIRNLASDDYFKEKPLILTYPTKILMDVQIASMRNELDNVAFWPEEEFISNGINILNYSSSAIVRYVHRKKINPEDVRKSDLLENIFSRAALFSKKRVIVTSPDVLHILINLQRYGSRSKSRKIANTIQGAYVFFDEFHVYSNLKHFPELIDNLLRTIAQKIVLLSATPYESENVKNVKSSYSSRNIEFGPSIGIKNNGSVFNYPLKVKIETFKYTDINLTFKRLLKTIPEIEKPAAIIFDSIFRLQHIKRRLEEEFSKGYKIVEWHGMTKTKDFNLDNRTIVLGTSSIEVGIDLDFKTLVTESGYWTSAIQRIGRVGRKSEGNVILFTKSADIINNLREKRDLPRSEFEEIIKKSLKDPANEWIGGVMFRGDSYNFIIKDKDTKEVHVYDESIFSMFDIDTAYNPYWKTLSKREKGDLLREQLKISENKIEELMLYDSIFPFWGVLNGRLKNKYDKIEVGYPNEDNNKTLTIMSNNTYTFYGE